MSYNGSGVFNINTTGQPVVSGTVISSTAFNALTADLATGLTTALTKDGQTTPTANIKLGGYKLVNVGTGTAATDAVNLGQVQSGAGTYLAVSGTDTLTGSLTPALTAYTTGSVYTFKAAGANTGAVTLNIDGLGAKAVTKNGTTALAANDIRANRMVTVSYDGTQFQIVGLSMNFDGTTLTVPTVDATTSLITRGAIGLGVTPSYGTSGQVLTSAGSGAAPTWTTIASSGMTFISTVTASSTSFGFTGLSGYDKYLLVFENVYSSYDGDLFTMQLGTGATPTYITSGYLYLQETYDFSSSAPAFNPQTSASSFKLNGGNGTKNASSGLNGTVLLINFDNQSGTNVVADINTSSYVDSATKYDQTMRSFGRVANASTRTAIKIIASFGNFSAGKVSLYGITS